MDHSVNQECAQQPYGLTAVQVRALQDTGTRGTDWTVSVYDQRKLLALGTTGGGTGHMCSENMPKYRSATKGVQIRESVPSAVLCKGTAGQVKMKNHENGRLKERIW